MDPVIQQRHDDGVQRQEVRDDLLVGDDNMKGSVLSSVHCLGVSPSLEQQLGGGGTRELTHLIGVKIIWERRLVTDNFTSISPNLPTGVCWLTVRWRRLDPVLV